MTAFDPTSPDDLAELREIADAATPGPWEAYGTSIGAYVGPGDCRGCSGLLSPEHEPSCYYGEIAGAGEADAEFIAASRTAVPALLDALATARAERDEALHQAESSGIAQSLAETGEQVQTEERYSNATAMAQAVLRADRAEERVRDMEEAARVRHGQWRYEFARAEAAEAALQRVRDTLSDPGTRSDVHVRRALDGEL